MTRAWPPKASHMNAAERSQMAMEIAAMCREAGENALEAMVALMLEARDDEMKALHGLLSRALTYDPFTTI